MSLSYFSESRNFVFDSLSMLPKFYNSTVQMLRPFFLINWQNLKRKLPIRLEYFFTCLYNGNLCRLNIVTSITLKYGAMKLYVRLIFAIFGLLSRQLFIFQGIMPKNLVQRFLIKIIYCGTKMIVKVTASPPNGRAARPVMILGS